MHLLKKFIVIVHKEDDMYVAECPEIGTISQGTTFEESIDNLKEATELYLEEFPIENEKDYFIASIDVKTTA